MKTIIPKKSWEIRPSPLDLRDYPYTVKMGSPDISKLPKKFVSEVPYVYNQGYFGTCGGMAGAMTKNIVNKNEEIYSPLYIYSCAKQIDGIPNDEGTHIRAILSAMRHEGACPEYLYPYRAYTKPLVFPYKTKQLVDKARERVIQNYVKCSSLEEVIESIYKYGAVICGMLIDTEFEKGQKEFLTYPFGELLGGHAVSLIGYDLEKEVVDELGDIHKGFFLLANSWGREWGSEGKIWIAFDYLFNDQTEETPSLGWDFFTVVDELPEYKRKTCSYYFQSILYWIKLRLYSIKNFFLTK